MKSPKTFFLTKKSLPPQALRPEHRGNQIHSRLQTERELGLAPEASSGENFFMDSSSCYHSKNLLVVPWWPTVTQPAIAQFREDPAPEGYLLVGCRGSLPASHPPCDSALEPDYVTCW